MEVVRRGPRGFPHYTLTIDEMHVWHQGIQQLVLVRTLAGANRGRTREEQGQDVAEKRGDD
jgi:hypothetical protein